MQPEKMEQKNAMKAKQQSEQAKADRANIAVEQEARNQVGNNVKNQYR